jgi:hypothetical protein
MLYRIKIASCDGVKGDGEKPPPFDLINLRCFASTLAR